MLLATCYLLLATCYLSFFSIFSAIFKNYFSNDSSVTADQFEELKQELETLKKRFNDTFSALTTLGVDSVIKKLESYLPPRKLQKWSYSQENVREGITRSDLITKLGFGTSKALEEAAALLELDPDQYLGELSGWQKRPVEEGSSRTRFFSPK